LIVTCFNLFKAFHIDDTFHIEAAQHILEHPSQPMNGEINWGGSTNSISEFNQPPFLFYLISIVIYFFGANEIALHLLVSVFSLFAIYYFERLLYHFHSKNANFFLIVFALCPAFVVNQNVMTDIPLLSLLMGSSYYFITSSKSNRNMILSFTLISLAILIKYSALPFLGAMIIVLVITKDYKNLQYIFIPIGLLILWSGWNYLEYGGVTCKSFF
jgi:4-amino-4-deoxy-L-arabinose transferase-like glycosyltransferase